MSSTALETFDSGPVLATRMLSKPTVTLNVLENRHITASLLIGLAPWRQPGVSVTNEIMCVVVGRSYINKWPTNAPGARVPGYYTFCFLQLAGVSMGHLQSWRMGMWIGTTNRANKENASNAQLASKLKDTDIKATPTNLRLCIGEQNKISKGDGIRTNWSAFRSKLLSHP